MARGLVRDEGRPAARAAARHRDGDAWLAAVHVTPRRRGQGLFDALVGQAAGWAREQGAGRLLLQVHEGNARARAAYARRGFVDTGEREPYPLGPGRTLVLARDVEGPPAGRVT